MSKLRLLKLIILIIITYTVFYITVYSYDVLAPAVNTDLGSISSAKYLLGTIVALFTIWITNRVSRQIYLSVRQVLIRLSLADFVIGIVSIIIGLVMGALATVPFAGLPGPWSWVLSLVVVVIATAVAIWAVNLKKATIIEWFNSIHFLQRTPVAEGGADKQARLLMEAASYINPMLLDTSAIIDHRIGEIIKSGFLFGTIVLPTFILEELQLIADSNIAEKRQRGRSGLKLLQQLKRSKKIAVVTIEDSYADIELVDSKLIQLATDLKAKIITCDYNLNAVAKVRGIPILNVNELALNLRQQYLPGELMQIKVVQAGKEDGQGLGYLADGTLVVIQKGKPYIGKEIKVEIQRMLQSTTGRMLFVKTVSQTKKDS